MRSVFKIVTCVAIILVTFILSSYKGYESQGEGSVKPILARGGQEFQELVRDGMWYRVTSSHVPVFCYRNEKPYNLVGYLKRDAMVYGQRITDDEDCWIRIGNEKYVRYENLTDLPSFTSKGIISLSEIDTVAIINPGCEHRYIDEFLAYELVDSVNYCWYRLTKKHVVYDEPIEEADTIGLMKCDVMVYCVRDDEWLKIGEGQYIKRKDALEIEDYTEKTEEELEYFNNQEFFTIKAEREFKENKEGEWYRVTHKTYVLSEPIRYIYEEDDAARDTVGILKRDAMVRVLEYCYYFAKIGEGKYVSSDFLVSQSDYQEKSEHELENLERYDTNNILIQKDQEFREYSDTLYTWYVIEITDGVQIYDDTDTTGDVLGRMDKGAMVYAKSCDDISWLQIGVGKFIPASAASPVLDYIDIETRAREKAIYDARVLSATLTGISPFAAKGLFFVILFALAFYFLRRLFVKTNGNLFGGPDTNGMTRVFFCRKEPYVNIFTASLYLLGAVIGAFVIMLVIGVLLFLLFIAMSYICRSFVATLAATWILYVLFCVLPKPSKIIKMGCVIVPILLSTIAISQIDNLVVFADSCYKSGVNLLSSFNITDFFINSVWQYLLLGIKIALTPLLIFLLISFAWVTFAYALRIFDWATTQIYNVKNPCPYCQEKSEPAVYLSRKNIKTDSQGALSNDMRFYALPIALRPGVYGLFHVKHPITGERMSTLLMNGRTKHPRRCHRCGQFISSEAGTNKHVAMIGWPGSGKSTLCITMLAELLRSNTNIKLGEDVDSDIKSSILQVRNLGCMTNDIFPQKTREGRLPSIRINIPRTGRPDYALYLDDVAGESFDTNKENGESLNFLYNTTSLIFVIDPFSTQFTTPGTKMRKWLKLHKGSINAYNKAEDLFMSVRTYIHAIDRLNEMTINFVLVKADTGYLDDINIYDEDAIKDFIVNELGLDNVINSNEFKEQHFYAVTTMSKDGGVQYLNKCILDQQNVILN